MADADIDVNVPGNWMARQLRLINDDSDELFPKTAASTRSRSKFNSLYTVDFKNPPYGAIYARIEDKKQMDFIQQNRETITDVLFGGPIRDQGKMFQKWRVPEHYVDTNINVTPSPRSASPPKTTRPLVQTSLPRIQPNECARPNGSLSARLPRRNASSTPKSRTPQFSAPQISSSRGGQSFKDKQAARLTGHWFNKSPHVDRAVIEEIMRLQQRKNLTEQVMRKKAHPDARISVEKWLQTATDDERKVALQFFTSLAASPQMETTSEDQGSRLHQVINILRRSSTSAAHAHDRENESPSRLQFINLLNPKERANRWQFTTWHHQPEYKQLDRVNNWSSHYTRPHAPPPRHFVIHPDWG